MTACGNGWGGVGRLDAYHQTALPVQIPGQQARFLVNVEAGDEMMAFYDNPNQQGTRTPALFLQRTRASI